MVPLTGFNCMMKIQNQEQSLIYVESIVQLEMEDGQLMTLVHFRTLP